MKRLHQLVLQLRDSILLTHKELLYNHSMTNFRKDLQEMINVFGEKLQSLAIDAEKNERESKWKKQDMLRSDFHHVTMNFKTSLIEHTKEL